MLHCCNVRAIHMGKAVVDLEEPDLLIQQHICIGDLPHTLFENGECYVKALIDDEPKNQKFGKALFDLTTSFSFYASASITFTFRTGYQHLSHNGSFGR